MADSDSKVALEPRTFKVTGMTCNACVNSVERSLNSMPGVSATVNFAAEKASVLFDNSISNSNSLVEAVKKAGYKAEILDGKDNEYEQKKRNKEIKSYLEKFSIFLEIITFINIRRRW